MAKTDPRPIALDTSVLIALVAGWHEEHGPTRDAVESMLSKRHPLVVPAPALVEAYSVLTRLPPPHRVSPDVANELLRANFADATVPVLPSSGIWRALDEAVERGVAGGRVHDWLIARTARHHGPCILLTLNERHFAAFDAEDFWVRTPATVR